MYGKTYGKLTYTISSGKYQKGQDVDPSNRYNSSYQETFVNQRDVHQRTAADMVGVKPKDEKYKKVNSSGELDSKEIFLTASADRSSEQLLRNRNSSRRQDEIAPNVREDRAKK